MMLTKRIITGILRKGKMIIANKNINNIDNKSNSNDNSTESDNDNNNSQKNKIKIIITINTVTTSPPLVMIKLITFMVNITYDHKYHPENISYGAKETLSL